MARPSAASRRSGSGESFRVDAREFKALNDRLKEADKAIARKLRKTLKASADDAVRAVRAAAQQENPAKVGKLTKSIKRTRRKDGSYRLQRVISGYEAREGGRTRSRGMRKAIAKATTSSLTNSRTTANLRVTTSQKRMPRGMGPMVKAWNTRMFRHPVFADQRETRKEWRWVYQGGTSYFTVGVRESSDTIRRNLARAMEKVADELAK